MATESWGDGATETDRGDDYICNDKIEQNDTKSKKAVGGGDRQTVRQTNKIHDSSCLAQFFYYKLYLCVPV